MNYLLVVFCYTKLMNIRKVKDFFLSALFEYSITLLFLIYLLTYNLLGLPSILELFTLAEKGFENYGLIFLFFGLLLEGLFIVGLYFPGSVIVFGSVVFWATSPLDLITIILMGSLTLVFVSFLNYLLGKYGYYKLFKNLGAQKTLDRMETRFQKGYKPTLMVFSSSPNFLAIASVYAGIAHIKLSKYLSFASLCILFWVSVVSIILYLFVSPEALYGAENIGWIAFFILLAWALFESILGLYQSKKNPRSS